MSRLLLVVLVGCVGTDRGRSTDVSSPTGTVPETDTDTDTPTDTGTLPTDDGVCPSDLQPLTRVSCAESTALIVAGTTYTTPTYTYLNSIDVGGTGLVIEVGPAFDPVPESEALNGFQACGAAHTHQVRLVDDAGETWTFGWDLSTAIDDDSAIAILPGSELDFRVIWVDEYYDNRTALLLSDALGPVFLLEAGPALTDTERGGISVGRDGQDSCIVEGIEGEVQHYLETFSWAGGQVALRSGDTALIPLPSRDLELVLGESSYPLYVLDAYGVRWWAAWVEAP